MKKIIIQTFFLSLLFSFSLIKPLKEMVPTGKEIEKPEMTKDLMESTITGTSKQLEKPMEEIKKPVEEPKKEMVMPAKKVEEKITKAPTEEITKEVPTEKTMLEKVRAYILGVYLYVKEKLIGKY